jgi:hypothetical protein
MSIQSRVEPPPATGPAEHAVTAILVGSDAPWYKAVESSFGLVYRIHSRLDRALLVGVQHGPKSVHLPLDAPRTPKAYEVHAGLLWHAARHSEFWRMPWLDCSSAALRQLLQLPLTRPQVNGSRWKVLNVVLSTVTSLNWSALQSSQLATAVRNRWVPPAWHMPDTEALGME